MNVRGNLKVSRDAAVVFARTFRRDRQRSFTTIPQLVNVRDHRFRPHQQQCLAQRLAGSATVSIAVEQRRRLNHSVKQPIDFRQRAWLGNQYGGLRKGDKGKSLYSSSIISS